MPRIRFSFARPPALPNYSWILPKARTSCTLLSLKNAERRSVRAYTAHFQALEITCKWYPFRAERSSNGRRMDGAKGVHPHLDREVIRCKTCGLVQYRSCTGNCRRCVRVLPQELPGGRQIAEKWSNRQAVENIGRRVRQLRESRGMTKSHVQARSRVSKSYLCRIESGKMMP